MWTAAMHDPSSKWSNEKTAIDTVFAEYTRTYALNTGEAAEFWTAPSIAVLLTDIIVLKTRGDVVNFLSRSLVWLKSLNYSHTETVQFAIKMLNAATALYGAVMRRIRRNGTILEEAGATYMFLKIDGNWRIFEGIITDTDNV
jgi:hypothetical protein